MEFLFEITQAQRRVILAVCTVSVLALGYGNQAVEAALQVSSEVLFLAPTAVIAWMYPRRFSLLFALYAAVVATASHVATNRFSPAQTTAEFLIQAGAFLSAALIVNLLAAVMRTQTHRARVDALTETVNTGRFHEFVHRELARAKRYDHPVTVAFIDLDNFKRVNDSYGHLVGDEALRSLAALMSQHVRSTDIVGRLGGDEFGILMPETGEDAARVVLERLRTRIDEYAAEKRWPISASIGAATVAGACCDVTSEEVVKRADGAMYRVKSANKDGVLIETLD